MTKSEWIEWKDNNRGDYGALVNFANDHGAEGAVDDLISDSELDERVKYEAESGWQRVACFLSEIVNNMNEDYYRIDAYGNADLPEDWDCYADEVENQLEFDEYCCDVCGEDTDTLYDIDEWISEEEASDELNLTDEERSVIVEYDDYYDRCPNCWAKLKRQAKFFCANKEKFEDAGLGFKDYVDDGDLPEGLVDPEAEA